MKKPYVILISLDGFRWDYVDRFNPPNLSAFIKTGVKSESLIPSFPSKTFPNHYTIATGMYPDKHGIIGNTFYSYDKNSVYRIRDRKVVEDGDFYRGSPIWIQANKANMVTASYFFVGSEADIQGIKPTYYYNYDGNVKNETRVDQALKWLQMPEKKRPHMITMYFSDMDRVGHRFGPNNDEKLIERLLELDLVLGNLFDGVSKTGLPVNIVIVSDHGMLEVPFEKYIPIEDLMNDELYMTINNGVIVNIHPKDNSNMNTIYNDLKNREENFKVYKTKNTPNFEYVPKDKNWGTIQIIPDEGYFFSTRARIVAAKEESRTISGQHGFDPKLKEMHGVFYANGPTLKEGYVIPSIKNIHIYPLLCEILGLEIPDNIDGNLNEIKSVLQNKQ
ncbi:ectonucleotide pyrophosphatase/phosphodiesterase [Aquimarina sp. AU474]|uniref:alkaline phosphatase family protein n=1 Tax=Aquimarina sp. AU474 TaxID=2108529 RepID=UPI001F1B36C9|nr:ectonucleotide pyrophosphatase/phosphodiesterase [Aquimarina sp. AU474]